MRVSNTQAPQVQCFYFQYSTFKCNLAKTCGEPALTWSGIHFVISPATVPVLMGTSKVLKNCLFSSTM